VPQHDGVEPRPTVEYFAVRTDLTSQGDIYLDVPVFLKLPRNDGGDRPVQVRRPTTAISPA